MTDEFYRNLESDLAKDLSEATMELNTLKAGREELLKNWGAASAEELLKSIASGEADEHPAYEQYLAARALEAEIEAVRERCRKLMEEA